MKWRIQMNNFKGMLCLSIVLLTGCSANEWSRVDNSEFREIDLDMALKECRYKEVMKKTNLSVKTASSGTSTRINPTDNDEELAVELERVQKSTHSSNKANSEMKHRSLTSASQAYQCVVEKGFVRV
jgi:hypothetical protein